MSKPYTKVISEGGHSEEFTAALDSRNRITIPIELAKVLRIKGGDNITVKVVTLYRIEPL